MLECIAGKNLTINYFYAEFSKVCAELVKISFKIKYLLCCHWYMYMYNNCIVKQIWHGYGNAAFAFTLIKAFYTDVE